MFTVCILAIFLLTNSIHGRFLQKVKYFKVPSRFKKLSGSKWVFSWYSFSDSLKMWTLFLDQLENFFSLLTKIIKLTCTFNLLVLFPEVRNWYIKSRISIKWSFQERKVLSQKEIIHRKINLFYPKEKKNFFGRGMILLFLVQFCRCLFLSM